MSAMSRINLLLAASILLLGIVYQLEPGLNPSPVKPVTSLDVSQVQQLKLYRQQKLAISLKREGDHWIRLPSPPTDCATPDCEMTRPALIRQWLHFAELPSLHSFPAPEERLNEFGLSPPDYQLQLDEQSIFIGSLDPGSQLRYVMVDGQIHLVSDSYTHTLKQNPW